MNCRKIMLFAVCMVMLSLVAAHAFNDPVDRKGTLTVQIKGPEEITVLETPVVWEVELKNDGVALASGLLHINVIDEWRIEGKSVQPFSVAPGKTITIPFSAIAGKGTYNAWYPIHAYAKFEQDKVRFEAHPVLLVRTNVSDVPRPEPALSWKPITIPPNGQRSLIGLPVHRVVVEPFNGDPILLPVGWRGTESFTRAVVHTPGTQALPESHKALFVHPPWFEGHSGMLCIEMPVALPETTPLHFDCFLAIQQQAASEPPSDGVTFRVYVAPLDAAPGALGELLFEKHTDSKTWEPISVDLGAYAGQSVLLQLETHPGPAKNTTCDRGLWGDMQIVAGNPEATDTKEKTNSIALGTLNNEGVNYDVEIATGIRGLLDGAISFITASNTLTADGFAITVLNDALEAMNGACVLVDVMDESNQDCCRFRHRFESPTGVFDLLGELHLVDGKTLRATFSIENTPEPHPWLYTYIEDASLGAWNQQATQVYAGVGNVIRNPEPFSLSFDGHRLATSFVGFDFAGGTSIVMASESPPSRLEVTPDAGIYTLYTPVQPIFTLIPTTNVWQGVKVWREINGLKPAGGVQRLAGRFVFDLWGGHYGTSVKALQEAFRYGLTNSAVVWHNWQRWGYDYRLPDICPPNPDLGTLEEFQQLAAVCRDQDVIFAPHDNYIDFYPDAKDFSFKHIGFNNDGHPIWAWLNEGRKAQSFRWNVESLRPFLERNLEWIREFIQPTGYFIDVWSSIGPYEAWTYDGRFQDRLLHRKVWGESFAWIREYLGGNAPQISESGHDQLIGYLDGAQTNHLRVDASPPKGYYSWTVWPVRCEDAERIPWSDMAHHDRFVLHGAGYESRYLGGLRADLHGIYSDDYITSEVLTGHPGMVPRPFGRDVVRKYWLTNDLMTQLALKQIESVDFDGSNLHRQHVRWQDTGDIWVNRDGTSWEVNDHQLPQYGYYADLGTVTSAIEVKNGVIVEWSKSPETWYVNARPVVPTGLPASVKLKSLTPTEGRNFEINLEWKVSGPIEEDLVVYIHFVDSEGKILFQADSRPQLPTNEWRGTVVTTAHGAVPGDIKPGTSLSLQTGLWKPGDRRRPLQNNVHGDASVRLATVQINEDNNRTTGFDVNPITAEHLEALARMNPENVMIDFDGVATNGACRIMHKGNTLEIMPLPESSPFELQIDLPRLPFAITSPKTLKCEDNTGTVVDVPLQAEGSRLLIQCKPQVVVYRLIGESCL